MAPGAREDPRGCERKSGLGPSRFQVRALELQVGALGLQVRTLGLQVCVPPGVVT